MNLIADAIPFFLLALVAEMAFDRQRGTGFFRFSDAVASLSTGALSTTTGLFTKVLELVIYAALIDHVALFRIDPALFDLSWAGIGRFLLVLLAWDFLYYWHHRFGHTVNLFWAAHVVHHQSEDYNLSTALRQTSTGFLFGWLFYLPLVLIGVPVQVVAAASAIDLIYQFWVHTQHIGSLGWYDRVFVSPSNHRVHHAQNERYLDKNYGGILILWDRLFGTFEAEDAAEPCVFGVRKPLQRWDPIVANLQIYRETWRLASRLTSPVEKLMVWFRRPNWRPADEGGPLTLDDSILEDFKRFQTPLPRQRRRYVLAQFLVAVALTGVVSIGAGLVNWPIVLLPSIALWALLVSQCRLMEYQANSVRNELWRLIGLNPLLLLAAMFLMGFEQRIAIGLLLYTLLSVVALSGLGSDDAANIDGAQLRQ
ncbi:MAG: sterol desaturase family protein [Pseudomonadota bacterium]